MIGTNELTPTGSYLPSMALYLHPEPEAVWPDVLQSIARLKRRLPRARRAKTPAIAKRRKANKAARKARRAGRS